MIVRDLVLILIVTLTFFEPCVAPPRRSPTPTPTPTPTPQPIYGPQSYKTNFTSPKPDRDFPGWSPTLETISSCSYIIPMDYEYQGCGDANNPYLGRINSACDVCTDEKCLNEDFNLFAYGLVNSLLWADIPVKWIIRTGKAHDESDIFNARTVLIYPHRLAPSDISTAPSLLRNFSGGPFLVETVFTPFADPYIMNYTLSIAEVRVFLTKDPITVDVRYTLLSRPYVAVLSSSGEQYILEAALLSAGFQKGLHWDEMTKQEAKDKLGSGVCITMAMEPHFHACTDTDETAYFTNNSAAFVSAARSFLNYGSNFYAMCGGIDTYEQCDNEDGTSCYSCDDLHNCKCPGSSGNVEPCYGSLDLVNDDSGCTDSNKNVGILSFNQSRQQPLCSSSSVGGTGYGRGNPIVKGYCPDGFFVTENVADSSYGGLYTPPSNNNFNQLNSQDPNAFYYNMAPDIPFNQYNGKWEYEDISSIRYMSLWNQVADGLKNPNQQTKLRSANWAHFTISENVYSRDVNTNWAGYPYGVYFAAHAKLPQFQEGQGGNIFYVAGHHYSNRISTPKTGYYVSIEDSIFGHDESCVDAGVAPPTGDSLAILAKLSTGTVAQPNGGGCYNRVGRRFLLNAVLTPSNLTCNVARTICDIGGCRVVNTTVNFDPCKAFGICSGGGFKRSVLQVPSSSNGNSSGCPQLKCGCDLYLDCCGVCGGDGTSCKSSVNNNTGMSGTGVGAKTPLEISPGVSVGAIEGDIPPNGPVFQPPLGGNAPPDTSEIVAVLSVANMLDPSWPTLLGGRTVQSNSGYYPDGPVVLQLSDISKDEETDAATIKQAAIDIIEASLNTVIDSSRITVVITGTTVTVAVDGNWLAPEVNNNPTAPVFITPPTANFSVSNSYPNLQLDPDECQAFIFNVGTNILSASVYAALQTPTASGVKLTIYLSNGYSATTNNYDCVSPILTDNNEYEFHWEYTNNNEGYFSGHSSTYSPTNTCSKNLPFVGSWYSLICSGKQPVTFSYQVSLVPTAVKAPVDSVDASSSSILYGYFLLIVLAILALL